MRVLFIGGTGNISGAVSRLAVERGIDLCAPEPGQARRRCRARVLVGDYADDAAVRGGAREPRRSTRS